MDTNTLLTIAQLVVILGISFLGYYFNKKLKDLEVQQMEQSRQFEIKRVITLASIDKVVEAQSKLAALYISILKSRPAARAQNSALKEEIRQGAEYIEYNRPYLPADIREGMHNVSARLKGVVHQWDHSDEAISVSEILLDVPKILQESRQLIEQFFDRYNLVGNTTTSEVTK
jgi:hypothetical protein